MTKLISTETGKTHADAASEVAATLAKLNNSILAYKKRTGSERNSLGSHADKSSTCISWRHVGCGTI